jgi:hypothetical protein
MEIVTQLQAFDLHKINVLQRIIVDASLQMMS